MHSVFSAVLHVLCILWRHGHSLQLWAEGIGVKGLSSDLLAVPQVNQVIVQLVAECAVLEQAKGAHVPNTAVHAHIVDDCLNAGELCHKTLDLLIRWNLIIVLGMELDHCGAMICVVCLRRIPMRKKHPQACPLIVIHCRGLLTGIPQAID